MQESLGIKYVKQRRDYPFNLASIRDPEYVDRYAVTPEKNKYVLGIGLTSRCNFDCPICYYHDDFCKNSKETDISLDKLKIIFANCAPLHCINFALEGEPFCYPHLFQALDYAMEASEFISISTNGSLLTKDKLYHLSKYKFSLFSLSINAADSVNYSYFHKGGHLLYFLRNAGNAVENLGSAVIFNTVICQQNLHSLLDLPRLAAMVGISTISLMQLRTHRALLSKGITPAKSNDLLLCLESMLNRAEYYGITLYFDHSFTNKDVISWLAKKSFGSILIEPARKKCIIPWCYTSILSSGKIFPCCGDFQPVKINSYTFDGIFNHDYLRMLRGHIAEGKNVKACALCRHEG